ncbi:Asp-tRNA(Asn)/Glu-tRNA(Gln) amidotransferase GatCAB subunit C [Candidatus Woesearchaeota archaeon]|nr:MAG: Asp-tRNA(Asn)/Glu-tRNA(Gln) amidotransferase GatCAB subunit C [Candidatus Woesearchaeota archaeon]
MDVDEKLVKDIAKTARLNLTDEEVKKFTPQLKEVISYFEKLDEIDTENVKMSIQPVEVRNVLRDDVVEESYSNELALSQTKHKKDGYFKGPSAL